MRGDGYLAGEIHTLICKFYNSKYFCWMGDLMVHKILTEISHTTYIIV